MAIYKGGMNMPGFAGEDLSDKLYYICKVDTDKRIVLAGSGEAAAGVIYETAEEDRPVTYMIDGVAKVILGATVAAGAEVMSDGNGKAITRTGTNAVLGVALEGGGANNIVPVALSRGGH